METIFLERQPIKLNYDHFLEIDNLSNDQFKNLIIIDNRSNREVTYDIGKLCFKSFKRRSVTLKVSHVIENSVDENRIIAIKKYLIDYILHDSNQFSMKTKISELNCIINYINLHHPDKNINNMNDAKTIYIDYSNLLLHQINSIIASNTKKSDFSRQQTLQKSMGKLLAYANTTTLEEIQSFSKKIISQKINRPILFNDPNKINNFIKKQLLIFKSIANSFLKGQDLPFYIDLREINQDIIYLDQKNYAKNDMSAYINKYSYKDLHLLNMNEFYVSLKKYFTSTSDEYLNLSNLHRSKIKRIEEENSLNLTLSRMKISYANLAINSFRKAFIGVTGANQSITFRAVANGFQEIAPEKGMRCYATKIRGKNKTVEISFGIKFQEYFKLYLEFRNYISSFYQSTLDLQAKELLFFEIVFDKKSFLRPIDIETASKYRKKYFNIFKEETFTDQALRKNVAQCYLNLTNDTYSTAEKLGNTPTTVAKHYSDITFEEMGNALTVFFTKLDQASIFQSRKTTDPINVKINLKNTTSIPLGSCEDKNPRLIDQFTKDSVIPDCNRTESCLFCEHYVIHTNDVDLRKLLSFEHIIKLLNLNTTEMNQILFRINEIIDLIRVNHPKISNIINEIKSEVDEGFYDSHWENHLILLIDLGAL